MEGKNGVTENIKCDCNWHVGVSANLNAILEKFPFGI